MGNNPSLAKSLVKLNAEITKLQAGAAFVEAEMDEKLINERETFESKIEEVRMSLAKSEEEILAVKTDILAKEEYEKYVKERIELTEKDTKGKREDNDQLEKEFNELRVECESKKATFEKLEIESKELLKSFRVMRQDQENIVAILLLLEDHLKIASEARKKKLQVMFDEEMRYSMESAELKKTIAGPNGLTVREKLAQQRTLMMKCDEFLAASVNE